MNDSPQTWQITIYAIIFHPTEARILLLPGEDGWSLPHFQRNERLSISKVNIVCQAIQQQLGLDTNALRCVSSTQTEQENLRLVERIYTLESHMTVWTPPAGSIWAGLQELVDLPLSAPEQRQAITTCLQEVEVGTVSALCAPWYRKGWFAQATAWIRAQLLELGYTINGPIEQVQYWGISSVMRIPTTAGNVYFKASLLPTKEQLAAQQANDGQALPLLFANEPALTRSLSSLYPEQVPGQLAVACEQGWMLMKDFGKVLDEHEDSSIWQEAIRQYSHMQIASIPHIDMLWEAGCLDRRLERLTTHIDELINDTDRLANSGLNQDEIEQLHQYAPLLKSLCNQLASYDVPATLVHGDLHGHNIAFQDGKYIFFDWTDACIAHPFFDLITMPETIEVQGETFNLSDIYLEQWKSYASIEKLREAWAIARLLALTHQMVSFQHIVANLDGPQKGPLQGGLSYWARQLLQFLAERKE
ncbi:MAG TPA: aminoglycoside phosphotransferase family protein [Ktedonobacteraceae bacterium]|nr:aminoglycoside phosphotransferase family protein [Ktedonobacteraceae bacterium]